MYQEYEEEKVPFPKPIGKLYLSKTGSIICEPYLGVELLNFGVLGTVTSKGLLQVKLPLHLQYKMVAYQSGVDATAAARLSKFFNKYFTPGCAYKVSEVSQWAKQNFLVFKHLYVLTHGGEPEEAKNFAGEVLELAPLLDIIYYWDPNIDYGNFDN